MLEQRVAAITEILQDEAGKQPLQDRFHSGYIQAVKDILRVELDEVKEA